MLRRSGKITAKTLEMRTGQFPTIDDSFLSDSKNDVTNITDSFSFSDLSIDSSYRDSDDDGETKEMDDATKTVYTDMVINGLRNAGIDVSGLEHGVIEPLGKKHGQSAVKPRVIDNATNGGLAYSTSSLTFQGNNHDKIADHNNCESADTFTRFDINLPDIDIPAFNMPKPSGSRYASTAVSDSLNADASNATRDVFAAGTVETVSGIRYSDALGNTGAMTALDPDMLATHGMYARNISESAKRAFMAATAREDATEAVRGMSQLGTVRRASIDSQPSYSGSHYARYGKPTPQHAAADGQMGTAAGLVEYGYKKPTDDTSTFVALAGETTRSMEGRRFKTQSVDDTSTFIALAEKSREIIENGIDDKASTFDKAKHIAKLAGAETPIAMALVAIMTLGLGGMAATGQLSDAGSVTSGIGSRVNGIISGISDLTTTAGAETATDDTSNYPHETINMADVLTGKQTQVMSWTGYCADGWWFSGRTWPTDILPNSGQETVHDAWNAAGSVFTNHVATLNGRYLVAVKPALGSPGQYIDIALENGTVIPAIVADTKGNENYGATDYKYVHSDGSIIELEVDADYGIDKSTGDVKSSGNVQTWIPEWASLVKSITKYERYV